MAEEAEEAAEVVERRREKDMVPMDFSEDSSEEARDLVGRSLPKWYHFWW